MTVTFTNMLVAWSLFTTLLGVMTVTGWIVCERKHR